MALQLDKPVTCPILIGRTSELANLNSLIDLARSGQGNTALVSGEAGIGKSRLIDKVRSFALAQGFLILQGDCFQTDVSYPYAPILDFLRTFFANHSPTHLSTDQASLVRELIQVLPDLAPLFPRFAPAAIPPSQDPKQQKHRLFVLLAQFLSNQAARQPVLLLVEDLHWCDESSLELMLHLARRATNQPLFLLFTYRREESSPALDQWLAQFDREHLGLELHLGPLSKSEVAAMLHAIFSESDPLPVGLLDSIYDLSEGIPLFVEEMLKSLMITGDLNYTNGSWAFEPHIPNSGIFSSVPRSIDTMLKQRMDKLSKMATEALTLAAVSGRRFDFVLLQQMLHCKEKQLLLAIKELIAAQLVVEISADQFAFRHALIREAFYNQLLARQRQSLHRQMAETLEALFASSSQADAHLEDLAYHFYEAGNWAKALDYEQGAGEKALVLYAPGAAIEHLTHALTAANQLHVTLPGKIYLSRGQAYATRGEFDRANKDYELALETARLTEDGSLEWQSMMALGSLWAERDYAQVGIWLQRANDLALRLGDLSLQARTLNRLGNWFTNTGRIDEALQAHQEALKIFEKQQDRWGIAETLDLLGTTYGMAGDRVRAVEQLDRAIELFKSQGDTQSELVSLAMLAIQSMPGACETSYSPLKTQDGCIQAASEALRLALQIDSLIGQAFAENALTHALVSFGDFGSALIHAQEAQRIAFEIEHRQWIVATHHCLGDIYLLMLAPDLALTSLEAGLSLAQELGSTFWVTTLTAKLGLVYILKHDLPAAQRILQSVMPQEQSPRNVAEREIGLAWGELLLAQGNHHTALRIADQLLASAPGRTADQPAQAIPHLLRLKGEALLGLSDLENAMVALENAKHGAQERNARPILWTIQRLLGQTYQLLGFKDQARQEFAEARELIEALAATIGEASTLREHFLHAALGSLPKEKPLGSREAANQAFGGLSAREREVARLIAQGQTSREIAALLVLSDRTVEVHVSNILKKLGFASRTQIAIWAVGKGLAKH
jgi:DNA-binding CsgD family transcriptional regulator